MNVLAPKDWQTHRFTELTVYFDEVAASTEYFCELHLAKSFFAEDHGAPLCICKIVPFPDGRGRARLTNLLAWGACIIAVRCGGVLSGLRGINLAYSENTKLMLTSAAEDKSYLSFPLESCWSRFSNVLYFGKSLVVPDQVAAVTSAHGDEQAYPLTLQIYGEERIDALPSLSLSHCLGNEDPAFKRLLVNNYDTGRGYLALFKSADVYLRSGLVIYQDGMWGDSAYASVYPDKSLEKYPDLFRHQDQFGRFYVEDLFRVYRNENVYCLLVNAGFGNIGHWIMNSLLAAFFVSPYLRQISGKFICPQLPGFAKESLGILGLTDLIHETTDDFISFDYIYYPSQLSTHANMFPSRQVIELRNALLEAAASDPKSSRIASPERVYITRRGSNSSRSMSNEQELIDVLESLEFVTVATQDLSFLERIRVFAKAKVVVGQMGAGLVHILFAPRECTVIEVTSAGFHSNEFWYLGNLLGQRYVRFMAEETVDETSEYVFKLNIEGAKRVLSNLCR